MTLSVEVIRFEDAANPDFLNLLYRAKENDSARDVLSDWADFCESEAKTIRAALNQEGFLANKTWKEAKGA